MRSTYYHGTYRDRLDSLKTASYEFYHVTDGASAEAILQDGFLGGWGDFGFGVYFWGTLNSAKRYLKKGGWDGSLTNPVILAVRDSTIIPIPQEEISPDWNYKTYEDMYWHPMDESDEDAIWHPMDFYPVEGAKVKDKFASTDFISIPLGQLQIPHTKVAISVPELVAQTNAFSVKRRPNCDASLINSNPKQLYLEYKVKCRESYSDPAGHDVRVKFDVSKVEETQNANDLDVQLNCSCPAFLYWGAQWNLHERGALLGKPRPELVAPNKRLDLRSNFILCVAPGTRILMKDGTEKLIENVQVGDYVITHKGRPRKVINTASRLAWEGEMAREIFAKGAADSLVVSEEHPLAVVRGNEVCFCGCKGQLSSSYRGLNWGRKYLSGHHQNRPYRRLTKEAVIEIKSSVDNQYTLAEKYGVSQPTISKIQNKVAHVDDVEVEDCSLGKLHWIQAGQLVPSDYLYFPKFVWPGATEVNLDLASLLGYYLAEGNPIYQKEKIDKIKSGRPSTRGVVCSVNGVSSRVWGVVFTLNQDELETVGADIKTKSLRLLGSNADIQTKFRSYRGKKWLNVIVNDGEFAAKLISLAGCGSITKRLSPEVFQWNINAIQSLVSSYALGDGHLDSSGQQCVYSISPHLISQISTILYSMGIWHGRLYQDWQGKKKDGIRKKNRYYRLYWNYKQYPQLLNLMRDHLRPHVTAQLDLSSPKQETDAWQEGFLRVLYSITEVVAPDHFHDLTVEEDESFIANGVVVHNCKHAKTVLERILPSVQHNIINIVREKKVKENKDQLKRKVPESLTKKQDEMKKRLEMKKIRETKNKEIKKKLLDALRQREEDIKNKNKPKEEGEIGRTQPATEHTPLVIDTPKNEDILNEEPEGTDDLIGLYEQEENKLLDKEHHELKDKPHLHRGLPYETEEEKKEHGHAVPTDEELIKALDSTRQKVDETSKQTRESIDNMRQKMKRKQTSLEASLLATVAGKNDHADNN